MSAVFGIKPANARVVCRATAAHYALQQQACFMAQMLERLHSTGASAGLKNWQKRLDDKNVQALDTMFPQMAEVRDGDGERKGESPSHAAVGGCI